MATHGGKADSLERLRDSGLLVPEFYVVDVRVLKQLGDKAADRKLINDFEAWSTQHAVESVAVRSSAEGEDGKEQSFAGQFVSVMDIRTGQQLLAALHEVATSKPQAGYGSAKKYKVHAIVQRYIGPDVAGVLFTVNPSNGQSEMLINAAPGHGGKVVDGQPAASFHIDRVTRDARAENQKDGSLLSPQLLAELAIAGETIERLMQCPQDIEWAAKDDKLYLLQARPITQIANLKVWDNANIGESFPGIVMPLTFSIARRGYELVYKSQGYEGGLSWYQLEAHHRTFHDMVGLFGGRMYYNLASWYKFIGLFPSNHRNQKFLDEQLQTAGDVVYLPPSSYPLRQKLRFYSRATARTLFFEREKRRYWDSLERAFCQYDALPLGQTLPLLLERYTFMEQAIVPLMGRSADNDFFVMTYHGLLKQKLRAWLGEERGQTANFLGALHDVISARQAELLFALAQHINADRTASKLLRSQKYEELDAHLQATDALHLLDEYRTKFLHRFAGDQKIEAVNPLLELSGFYELISTYCQLDETATTERRTRAVVAERRRHKQIVSELSFLQKAQYKFLLHRLKHHLRVREHNRLLRGKAYALLRDLFPQVGQALVEAGIIAHAGDVYYLDIEEIMRHVDGTGYGDDAKRIVEERKHRYKTYAGLKPRSRFITTGLTSDMPPVDTNEEKLRPTTSLKGTLSSPGDVEGRVVVLDEPVVPKEPFDILVVSHTDPGWTPLIALAKGVIVEHGGILSHAAIVTRELGIPSMIGVENATQLLRTGMKVRINSAKSTIDILK